MRNRPIGTNFLIVSLVVSKITKVHINVVIKLADHLRKIMINVQRDFRITRVYRQNYTSLSSTEQTRCLETRCHMSERK